MNPRNISTRRLTARTLREAFIIGILLPLAVAGVGTGLGLLAAWWFL